MVLRILCLHGFRQSGCKFRGRTAALRKALRNHAELVCIDAPWRRVPQLATTTTEEEEEEKQEWVGGGGGTQEEPSGQRAWWDAQPPRQEDGFIDYVGWQRSVGYVREFIVQEGPFDGILGFSQGAVMASLLCALQASELMAKERSVDIVGGDEIVTVLPLQPPTAHSFSFAIIVSGFISRATDHQPLFESLACADTVPATLHVMGKSDVVVEDARSRELAALFGDTAEVLEHDGGHAVPLQKREREALKAWIVAQLHRKEAALQGML